MGILYLSYDIISMGMDISESDLPGVGKKFRCDLSGERSLVIVIHNTGTREIYIQESAGEDAEKVLELSDHDAREVGAILEGAYFQPVKDQSIKAHISDETIIEWFEIGAGSELVGKELGEIEELQRHDLIVTAVEKDRMIPNPEMSVKVEEGDIIVVMGSEETIEDVEDELDLESN